MGGLWATERDRVEFDYVGRKLQNRNGRMRNKECNVGRWWTPQWISVRRGLQNL